MEASHSPFFSFYPIIYHYISHLEIQLFTFVFIDANVEITEVYCYYINVNLCLLLKMQVSLMNFYEQLRDMRKLKGFTIRELADRSGVSSAYISQLENGNRGVPSPDVLMKLSEGLNTPYSNLMQIAGYLEQSLDSQRSDDYVKPRVNLRRFLRENELIFDGIELTEQDKEWIERMLTVLFWKDKKKNEDSED
jgi:transcriptional regulator with XRE-family HTH domain